MVRTRSIRHRIFPVARDGWRFILPPLILALILAVMAFLKTALVLLVVAGIVAMFFRDPERRVPRQPGLILSPADGTVTSIEEVEIETAPGQVERLRCISIFLSVLNAHIQRAPTYGTIASVTYRPGKFMNAMNGESSDENEHNMVWMRSGLGTLGVKQIAGMIARRVVCHCHPGEHVLAGQRIGLIRFGSRTNLYFSLDASVRTSVGRPVKAGLSVLAEMREPATQSPPPQSGSAPAGGESQSPGTVPASGSEEES
ncbi:phosphatidylserine decarboxylase family protein [Candidatus Sumerlaeota bacterium]|nr:phosphatidylserine decarboxylase family protein [Candidatus Sumerlaeota bacterium]